MPNPHYQRILQQDEQLPVVLRVGTRAMSSWWTIGVLAVFVVGYVAAALVPVGGRYLWQLPPIDATQQDVLGWWPLVAGAWLLVAAILWAALRRIPWRLENLGRLVCVLGLATILVSQSLAFRAQTVGVAAVPISESASGTGADPLALTYTTAYGDPAERVLVVMLAGAAPINITLTGLPRWHDAGGDTPRLKVHDDPRIASVIGYGTRITTAAYLADGKLTEQPDGTQAAAPTPADERNHTALPYPHRALLAIEFITEDEQGKTTTTTAWLPFEPEGADSLIPKKFFRVEGLGSVGLAFRPASRKLPYAVASIAESPRAYAEVFVADADAQGKITQPAEFSMNYPGEGMRYRAIDTAGTPQTYEMTWLDPGTSGVDRHLLILIESRPAALFITAGLVTFFLGVILDFMLGGVGRKRNPPPTTNEQT